MEAPGKQERQRLIASIVSRRRVGSQQELAAAAAGIATAVPLWGALLIVAGALFVLTMLLGAFGLMALKRGTPPVPEQAIREAKLTTEALKDGHH